MPAKQLRQKVSCSGPRRRLVYRAGGAGTRACPHDHVDAFGFLRQRRSRGTVPARLDARAAVIKLYPEQALRGHGPGTPAGSFSQGREALHKPEHSGHIYSRLSRVEWDRTLLSFADLSDSRCRAGLRPARSFSPALGHRDYRPRFAGHAGGGRMNCRPLTGPLCRVAGPARRPARSVRPYREPRSPAIRCRR